MQIKIKRTVISLLTILLASLLFASFCMAGEVTIIGEVNDAYQIVADGQIYEVSNNQMGDDLVYNHISERVRVTGFVEEKDDMKIITVTSFEVVPE